MKILLLGANGRTGREVIRVCSEAGHELTAAVRAADRLADVDHSPAETRVGDPLDVPTLRDWAAGHDAVISVVGPRWPTRRAAQVYPDVGAALAVALPQAGVRRLVATSSALLFPTTSWLVKGLKALVPSIIDGARAMEARVRESDLAWTFARTSFLSNADDERLVALRPADIDPRRAGAPVARAAVAQFLVEEVVSPLHVQQVVGLYGGAAPARQEALAAQAAPRT